MEDLGNVLHKYLNPLYEDNKFIKKELSGLSGLKGDVLGLKGDVLGLKSSLSRVENELDELKRIQLRMEHKLDENIKILHDRDDAHDKKLSDHDSRIRKLEKSV